MKREYYLAVVSLLLCMSLLMACGTITSSGLSNNDEAVKIQEEKTELPRESDESTVEKTINTDFEETVGDYSTASDPEAEELAGEIGHFEESDILIGSVGTVEMTSLSSEESRSFEGKEMIADPNYLENAKSSDVYYCKEPLDRIEVHPIDQWAQDFSSYTVSVEVLGKVESTEADEPFRIFDVYPEGIPNNCVVFYLEDGSCGSFSLGYNGSGEEHVWDNAVYKNFASMEASREKDLEEGAANAILLEYEDIIKEYADGAWANKDDHVLQFHAQLNGSSIPQFGKEYSDDNGISFCEDTESHFQEIYQHSWKSLGIARIDLNDDGTKELIVGYDFTIENENDQPTQLIAAYDVKGGIIRTIFQGWSRSLYYLTSDGYIIHESDSGYMDYRIIKYALAEDEDGVLSFQEVESVVVDGNKDSEKPFFYYPDERVIVGYDEYDLPIYTSENMVQMDEKNGKEYYNRILDEAIHVDLDHLEFESN